MRASLILQGPLYKKYLFLLVMIIALSAYTHMWNPAGFFTFHGDESIYTQRGVMILNHEVLYGLHDHPFFGQIVLAGFMHVTGYQNLIDDPSTDPPHLEAFYAYPRTFMGLLAVLDTLLVYMIAERMFGRRVAAVAAVIFAVVPMSLMLRLILLDSILLPFVLSSVLLALHSRGSDRRHLLLLASGACLGLAIFTKVPAGAMIPPCAILAYWASGRIRDVGLWIAPAVAIPAIWPAYAAQAGQFDAWIRDIGWQANRENTGILGAMGDLMKQDPVLIPLGMAGFAFAVICLILRLGRGGRGGRGEGGGRGGGGGKVHTDSYWEPHIAEPRNLGFLIAWFSSILLFFSASGFVGFYHLSTLLPALCIAAAVLIMWGTGRFSRGTQRGPAAASADRTVLITVAAIGLAGLFTAGVIVDLDVRSSEFEAASFLLQNYSDEPDTVKVVSSTWYWVMADIYGLQNTAGLSQDNLGALGSKKDILYGQQGTTGPSYRYAPPDAEKVVLMFSGHDKKFLEGEAEGCDYTADTVSPSCRRDGKWSAYNIMRLYNDGSLIKEFEAGVSLDAFPPLPPKIERHLINPSYIVEWTPAG